MTRSTKSVPVGYDNTERINTSQIDDLTKILPVYLQYPRQCVPQSAFIELDIETGEVRADRNGIIGNAVPTRVWHGIVRRYDIRCDLSAQGIRDALAAIRDDLQTVLDGSEVKWDGNNYVARLSDEAWDAEQCIEQALERDFENPCFDTDDMPFEQ